MEKPYLHANRQQKGAVLLVALVMLLLLTIIGVTSMRGTSLQENMANNLKERQLAFQAAEAALRAGERRATRERWWLRGQDRGECFDGNVDNLNLSQNSEYEVCLLDKRKSSLDSHNEEANILMVRVDAKGYGLTVDSDNKPTVEVNLRSTYRIELD